MEYDVFLRDKKTIYAVNRALEIIGEATKNIPASVKSRYPKIPWKKMAGMRDSVRCSLSFKPKMTKMTMMMTQTAHPRHLLTQSTKTHLPKTPQDFPPQRSKPCPSSPAQNPPKSKEKTPAPAANIKPHCPKHTL